MQRDEYIWDLPLMIAGKRDDSFDDDFIEDEWRFVEDEDYGNRDDDDDDDDDDDEQKPGQLNWYVADDDDTDDDSDDALHWDSVEDEEEDEEDDDPEYFDEDYE